MVVSMVETVTTKEGHSDTKVPLVKGRRTCRGKS